MGTKLAQRAYDANKLIEDASFKQRTKQLESIGERGFALILYWNQIEPGRMCRPQGGASIKK